MFYYSFQLSNPFLYYKCGEFYADTPWKHKEMYHLGDYEVIICTKGVLYIQIAEDRHVVHANDVLLVPPYTKMFGYQFSQEPVNFYWLHFFVNQNHRFRFFEEKELMKELSPLASKSYVPSLNEQIILPRLFHLDDPAKVMIYMNQILDISNSYRYSEQENDYLITAFLIELSHHFLIQLTSRQPYSNNKLDKIKEWICANISEVLTVEEVARAFQFNPDYLTRLFKRYESCTTLQYINNLKIEIAQTLLIRTNLPIKQIAAHSFFGDEKNFMRRFKAKTGLTPTEYRNAFLHTHLNNPLIDPLIPLPRQLEKRVYLELKQNGDVPKQR